MEDLEQQATHMLEDAATNCVPRPCNELDWDEIVKVSDFDVIEAARCQAKVAGPDTPFVPDVFNTHKAIALASYRRVAGGASVTAAVSNYMSQARSTSNWIGQYLQTAPAELRTQTAVRAITWLTRTLDVLGETDLDGWAANNGIDWRYPGCGLMLRGKIDLLQVSGGLHRGVIVATSPSEAFNDKVAFLAALFGLSRRRELDEIVVLIHSTGERLTVEPSSLYPQGLVAAQRAANGVSRRTSGPHGLNRSAAHFTCQSCHWHEDCEERAEATRGPEIRGGVRLRLNR